MKITTRVEEVLKNKSSYCYENGTLINKLGIKDKEELDEMEAALTYLRLCKIENEGFSFKFDPSYYLSLHKYIFQDIYDFAGEVRNENISKPVTFNFKGEIKSEIIPFCRPEFVFFCLKDLLEEMRKKARDIKSIDDYINYLSYYYSEINVVHPFREGNGRTQREYFRQLVEVLNKYLNLPEMYLDYSCITENDRNNLMQGCINSAASGDLTLLKEFFKAILKEKNIEKEKTV